VGRLHSSRDCLSVLQSVLLNEVGMKVFALTQRN
jgi:hypothetical protein